MKWIFLAFLIALVPILTAWLRTKPKAAPWAWSLLSFLPFVAGPWHLGVAPISTPTWLGYIKGWEVTLIDAVAIAVIFGTPSRWPRLFLLVPFLLYILMCLIAVFQAPFAMLAFSYIVQLTRMLIVFLAVAKVTQLEEGQFAILRGLAIGIAVQAVYALIARAGGALQTGGSLGHQNLLGFVSHMALLPCFAMLLSGKWPRWSLLGTIAGLVVVALGASRATIALSGAGLVLTLLFSTLTGMSARKGMISVAGVLMLLAAIPLVQVNLERRLVAKDQTFFESDAERAAFERAAHAMHADYPQGVGPNHYVFKAITEGYSERAGVYWGSGSRATNVHNSYLLMLVETGLVGVAAFILLLFTAFLYAFSTAITNRRYPASAMLIGVACAIFAVAVHGLFEWMFVLQQTQYLLAASFGTITGMRSRYVRGAAARKRNSVGRIESNSILV